MLVNIGLSINSLSPIQDQAKHIAQTSADLLSIQTQGTRSSEIWSKIW